MRFSIKDRLARSARSFYPGWFTMAMSTGIISIAGFRLELTLLAMALFYINLVLYAVLCALFLLRVTIYFGTIRKEIASPDRIFGLFAVVAATCIVGDEAIILLGDSQTAFVLWVIASALWIVFMYAVFLAARGFAKPLARYTNWGWLLSVVSTQAVSELGTLIYSGEGRDMVLFFCLALFLLGGFLYIFITAFIFHNYLFLPVAGVMEPLDWVNMGAAAITTLSGTALILNSGGAFLAGFLPFVKGLTLFFWVAASWWIPILVISDLRGYLGRHIRPAYSPEIWAMLFPIGMYSVSTFQMNRALQLTFLWFIPYLFLILALISWIVLCYGLIRDLLAPVPK